LIFLLLFLSRKKEERQKFNMKTIGLIGGTTWASTVDYYKAINRLTNERLGGLNSAKILLHSVNYEEFKPGAKTWDETAAYFIDMTNKMQAAGADCLLLCANTMHMAADAVQKEIKIPLIHIAEATAKEIIAQKISKVGLLGTKFTMEQDFFKDRLKMHGIETLVPATADRELIHYSIYNEFAKGIFSADTKAKYMEIIERLRSKGAEGIILGCTEIPILIPAEECSFPAFDTTLIHAKAAVDFALA
jgi:aspartate racemase